VYGLAYTAAVLVALLRGGYPLLERFSKWLVALFTISLVAAALGSHPDFARIVRGLIPSVPPTSDVRGTWLMVTALIGTEAGSLGNLAYASFIQQKGWRTPRDLVAQRRDLLISVSAIFLIGMLTQIAAANTMFGSGVQLKTANDLIRVVGDRLGRAGVLAIALGLIAKIFSSTAGATGGNALVVADLAVRVAPGLAPRREALARYVAVALVVSPLYGLFVKWAPVPLVLLSQAASVLLVPVLSVSLIRLSLRRERMGEYVSGPVRTAALLVVTTLSLWVLSRNAAVWSQPLRAR
jgi:manganese transport protein